MFRYPSPNPLRTEPLSQSQQIEFNCIAEYTLRVMTSTNKSTTLFFRHRVLLLLCIAFVIALGLASRKFALFPEFLGKYPGDALWALMVYLAWALIKPKASAYRIAVCALITSYLVEFSQLIQTPWLNSFRHTTIGHLLLGTVFSWYDIIFYTVGIAIGFSLDSFWMAFRNRRN